MYERYIHVLLRANSVMGAAQCSVPQADHEADKCLNLNSVVRTRSLVRKPRGAGA